jgi:hypothetical protein
VLQMTAVARMLVVEDAMGLTEGHDAARAPIEAFLDRYEPLPRPAAKRRKPASGRGVSASRPRRTGTR